MDGFDALSTANEGFERRLRLVGPADWNRPTPCDEWDVRALVNHVVGGHRRHTMLLHGASPAEVEASRSVDHLGDDPVGSFLAAAAEVTAAFREEGALTRRVPHRAGDRTGVDLLRLKVLDTAVHSWDLARAIDVDDTLDSDVVEFVSPLAAEIGAGGQSGTFAPPVGEVTIDRSAQDRLLRLVGRQPNRTRGDGPR